MKQPAMQFYVGDWQSNIKLRRCTHAEKGVWLDVMCLMHDSEEYGVLRWPLKEIAQVINCKISELKSLVNKGVIKGADAQSLCEPYVFTPRSGRVDGEPIILIPEQKGDIWYSSRMVRDEHIRQKKALASKLAKPPIPSPDPPPDLSPKGGIGETIDDAPHLSPDPPPDLSPSHARPCAGGHSSSSSTSKESKKVGRLENVAPIGEIAVPPNPPSGWIQEFQEIKGWNPHAALACWNKFVEHYPDKTMTLTAWKLKWTQWWSKEKSQIIDEKPQQKRAGARQA